MLDTSTFSNCPEGWNDIEGDDIVGALEVGAGLWTSFGPNVVICGGADVGADETGFFVGGEVGADDAGFFVGGEIGADEVGFVVGVEVGAGVAGFGVFLNVGAGVAGTGVGAGVGFLVGEGVAAGCGEMVGMSSAALMAWLVSSHMFVRTMFCASVGPATPSMSIDPLVAKLSKLS